MSDHAIGNLKLSAGSKVARRWLQEEERFLGMRAVELLDVVGVVSANGNNLGTAF